jgi:hypothetical protein
VTHQSGFSLACGKRNEISDCLLKGLSDKDLGDKDLGDKDLGGITKQVTLSNLFSYFYPWHFNLRNSLIRKICVSNFLPQSTAQRTALWI